MLNEEYVAYKLWEYEREEVDRKLELYRKAGGDSSRRSPRSLLLTALFRSIFSSNYS